jgi:hypothetical protein
MPVYPGALTSRLCSKPPSWDCWVNACNRQACWATRSRRSSFREAGSRQQWLLGRFLVLWSKLDNLPGVLERNPLPSFSEVVRYVELDYFCHVIPAFSTSSGLLLPLDITRLRWSLLLVEANLVSGVGEISPLHSCGEHIGRRIRSRREAEVPVRSDSGSSESLFVWCSATQNKGSRSPIKRT